MTHPGLGFVPLAFRSGYLAERGTLIFRLKSLILLVSPDGFEPSTL